MSIKPLNEAIYQYMMKSIINMLVSSCVSQHLVNQVICVEILSQCLEVIWFSVERNRLKFKMSMTIRVCVYSFVFVFGFIFYFTLFYADMFEKWINKNIWLKKNL